MGNATESQSLQCICWSPLHALPACRPGKVSVFYLIGVEGAQKPGCEALFRAEKQLVSDRSQKMSKGRRCFLPDLLLRIGGRLAVVNVGTWTKKKRFNLSTELSRHFFVLFPNWSFLSFASSQKMFISFRDLLTTVMPFVMLVADFCSNNFYTFVEIKRLHAIGLSETDEVTI